MPAEWPIDPSIWGEHATRRRTGGWDRLVAAFAEQQHGVVERQQLIGAGMRAKTIDHRVALGRLQPVQRGVYAVGHRILTADGLRMAAFLATGPRAVLSHRAAAAIWELRPSDRLEVTAAVRRQRPGIQVHRCTLQEDELASVRGIPVTTVARTLLDLAAVLPARQVERVVNEAEVRRLGSPLSLARLIERHRGRRGVAIVRSILDRLGPGGIVMRSELESRFAAFVRTAGLPPPELNAQLTVGGRQLECDCVWRGRRVAVELDGRRSHGTAAAFERDRARDRTLSAHGWRVVRITWRQLLDEPEAVAADLRRLLGDLRHRPLDLALPA